MQNEPKGHLIKLDDTRRVFVGGDPEEPDGPRFVVFISDEGEVTKFTLSPEAAQALHGILLKPGGDDSPPIDPVWTWRLVVQPKEGEDNDG